jgi:mannose-6-phosphate isomerase
LRNVSSDLNTAADLVAAGDPKAAIRELLEFRADNITDLTDLVPSAAASAGLGASGVEALASVASNYPGDPGVFVAVLMDHRVLTEGEAVYVPAGVVHAYVNGTGIEVMTASDNVLRLGLTPKTIAIDEALAVLEPEEHPAPMTGDPVELPGGGVHRHYAPAGAPFVVDCIRKASFTSPGGDYRLVLAVSHHVKVAVDGVEVDLEQGQAVAIMANEGDAQLVTTGVAVVARPAHYSN